MSSATATSGPNTVPTQNGVPIAGFSLHNSSTNLNTGTVSNSQSYNYVQTGPRKLQLQSSHGGSPTTLANNHPTLALNGYVGGVMVTATGGASPPFTNYTKPYVITNLTGQPGDVGIFLPGNSSEMLASFNVGSVNAPANAMTSSNYLFGSLNGRRPERAERRARHLRQSIEFRSAGRGRVRQRGQYSRLVARRPAARVDRRLRQPAVGDGRERRREYVRVPDLDLDLQHRRQALRVRLHAVGFLERHQRRKQRTVN